MNEQEDLACNCNVNIDYSDPGFWTEATPEELPCRYCALGMMMDMSMAIIELRMRYAGDSFFDLEPAPVHVSVPTKDPEGKLIKFPIPTEEAS